LKAKITYEFSAEIWKHPSHGGWFFISLPKHLSKEIRTHLQWQEEGWGRMRAMAKVHEIEWDTTIWFDKKHNTYLLPIKAEIRKRAVLKLKDKVHIRILL
jgi:hypothetical protein